MRSLVSVIVAILVLNLPLSAQLEDKVADRLWTASTVIDELTNAPDGEISTDLLSKAECVAVIPGVLKAAFGFGGRYGRGAVSCRKDHGKGPWGPPSMIAVGGGSFGFQIGGQSIDVVMLFMTPDSLKYLLRDQVTLGGDVSAAAGPKGRSASAETNLTMRSEILTYSRTRGLFAGVSLNGAVLKPDEEANKVLYKRTVSPTQLLEDGNLPIPDSARRFIDKLSTLSPAK